VLDPVMIAKGGAALLQADAVNTLRDALLPMATLLTPNLPEAAYLLGTKPATTRAEMAAQGRALCALGPQAVLMKGGHLDGAESPDCLVTTDDVTWFEAARTQTVNTHGTGCTLSSALAAQLAHGQTPTAATATAKSYVANAIAHADALSVGSGHGPTHHFAALYSK
jgi:hydroxymethylpyrimidine/phosphomethylpyrimidine kinase